MKTSDIKVGEEYRWQRDSWSPSQRVRVEEVGVEHSHRYDYRRGNQRVKNGVRVTHLHNDTGEPIAGSRTAVFASREIRGPWEEHAARVRLRNEEQELENQKAAAQRASCQQARDLLRDHCVGSNIDRETFRRRFDAKDDPSLYIEIDQFTLVLDPEACDNLAGVLEGEIE